MNLKKKKAELDRIYYEVGKQQYDFYVCGTFKDKEGKTCFTKWRKYSEAVMPIDFDGSCDNWIDESFFSQINQRQILPNEIVLDIEDKAQIKDKLEVLKRTEHIEEFSVWDTGSRGYHIHIFFKKPVKEKHKTHICKSLGADVQKCNEKNLIALENTPHWKTDKLKLKVNLGGL